MYDLRMDSTLAARLAALVSDDLAGQGLSYRDVQDRTGIPTTTLHRRLHGHAPFTFNELDAIAGLLGTTVTAMVARAETSAA